MGDLPLTALLSRSLVSLQRAFAAALPDAPVRPDLGLWSNLLRVLPDDGIALKDLPRAARLSKRMAASIAKGATWSGLVAVEDRVVRPTRRGAAVREVWRPLVGEAEAAWRREVGARKIDGLRRRLVPAVGGLPLELAHFPAAYGLADPSITGWGGGGADWRPVARVGDGGAADLPLHALLSQTLVHLAIDYERSGRGPLALAAGGLDPRNGLLGRHGLAAVVDGRPVLLPAGQAWRDAYAPLSAAVESRLPGAAGLRAALEAVDGTLDPALPHFPTG